MTDDQFTEYLSALAELERLRVENAQLRQQLADCAFEKIELQGQVRNLLYQEI